MWRKGSKHLEGTQERILVCSKKLHIYIFNFSLSVPLHILDCILLILFLEHAQLLLDPVQEVGAVEAAASSIASHHNGAEAADQHRGPVHVKLLRHHLATRCPIAANIQQPQQNNKASKLIITLFHNISEIDFYIL